MSCTSGLPVGSWHESSITMHAEAMHSRVLVATGALHMHQTPSDAMSTPPQDDTLHLEIFRVLTLNPEP